MCIGETKIIQADVITAKCTENKKVREQHQS